MSFDFHPESRPYPRWMGPFSPARGNRSGFRFHSRRLGTWVTNDLGEDFWPVVSNDGVRTLENAVLDEWDGGRVLFLPNGLVVKPLPGEEEVAIRVVIGRFDGPLVVETTAGTLFDFSNPGELSDGDPWPGPTTAGLECVLKDDGRLVCKWYHPSDYGRDEVNEQLAGPCAQLARGFCKARPGDSGGRVRITANGHVFTNRQEGGRTWRPYYVGWIDPDSLEDWDRWIIRSTT